MNYYVPAARPFLALVDDDFHSARMLTRMLVAHGAPAIRWMDGANAGTIELAAMLAGDHAALPGLVIVDLKASSTATREFIASLRTLPRSDRLLIVAIANDLDRDVRDALLDTGASAVFQRHADIEAYRRETAGIVSYWVRHQHLHAIGT